MLKKSRFVEMFGEPNANSLNLPLKRFDEICENLDSKRIPITSSERTEGKYPYYGASGVVDWVDEYIFDEDLLLISEDGANLVARVSPIAFSIKGKAWVNNHAHVLRFKEYSLQKYVEFYFNSINISSMVSGTAQPKLNQKMLNERLIPIPSKEKLEEFTNFWKQLDKLKVILKQIDEKFELLKKSRFVEMFKYVNLSIPQKNWKKISDIGEVIGGSTPKTTEDKFWNGDYKWVTPAEISSESHYINDTERHITEEGINSCSLQKLPKGTVLLTSRAPIGKVAIATSEMFCNQGFKNIVCNSQINPEFLYYLLKHNVEYLNSLGRGATFKEISKSIVENIRIPVPNITEQTAFVCFANQLDKLKVDLLREISLLLE